MDKKKILCEYLFQEGFIGNLKLKNRIVMAPMVTSFSSGGFVTDRLINYYKKRAEGGTGLRYRCRSHE